MEPLLLEKLLGLVPLAFIPAFYKLSPASKSTKLWTIFYLTILAFYVYFPENSKEFIASIRNYVVNKPAKAAAIAVSVGVPLKYLQRKLRFARINAIKMKYGYTADPASWENMTIEQAQEIESNMAEVSIPLSRSDHLLVPEYAGLGEVRSPH